MVLVCMEFQSWQKRLMLYFSLDIILIKVGGGGGGGGGHGSPRIHIMPTR